MLDVDGESLWQAIGEKHNRYSVEISSLVRGIGVIDKSSPGIWHRPIHDGIRMLATREEKSRSRAKKRKAFHAFNDDMYST
jgi:hypothetical protein